MNQEVINNEIKNAENEKNEKILASIERLKNKKNKFLFCVPEAQSPVASVYEIYFHATIVKKMGYEVIILIEKEEYQIPVWIEDELTNHKHVTMSKTNLTVSADDFLIIPEIYSNIMEQTKSLPCQRIGLLQSVDYMINSLLPGMDWKTFNINDIITTSQTLKEFIELYYGKNKFKIKTYDVGIPDYFKKTEKQQKPVISIIGRNQNEISKIVKLFFNKFPQYGWVTFDSMITESKPPQPLRRVDFAKRLQNNFAAVWVDRISSFGTFPLECMKSGVIPICIKPDIIPDYIVERNENGEPIKIADGIGVWTENFYDIPVLVGEVLIKYLEDNINPELYDSMEKIASKYSQENSENQLIAIYQEYVNNKISFLEKAII